MKLYRNFLMAGVVALGLSACGDDLTITDAPPPATTENIQSFSVSPTSATIAPGNFVQASATLVTAEGVTGSVAWSSSNPAVATVDANGRIDAVAEGTSVVTATATAGGQTATAAVGVTVRPIEPAQISIQSVTTGATDTPVNISNVAGQIEINMNFNPGEELVDSIAVFIGSKRAAKQVYVTSPSAGPVSLSVNTANYVKNVDAGTATVDFPNGATTISAAVYPRGGAATATNTIQIVLNNADGWAADLTKPSRSANDVDGVTFWGGPGEEGVATATLYPVIYTPGRTITQVSYRVGHIGYAGCPTVTQTELPFRASFGYGDVADQDCTGYEWPDGGFGGQRDNVVFMGALDNQSTPFPSYMSLISNSVVLGSTPDSARFDWEAPANVDEPVVDGANSLQWVKADWSFNPGTTNRVDDNGVGGDNASWVAVVAEGSSSVGDTVAVGGDLDETNTNIVAVDGYKLKALGADRLGNSTTSALTDDFGVDVTAPQIRYSVAAAPSSFASSYNRATNNTTADSASSLTAYVGIAGADGGSAATGDIVDYLGTGPGNNDSTRTDAIDNRSGLFQAHVTTTVFGQGAPTGTTTPALGACASTGAYGAALVDGWRTSPQRHLLCDATAAATAAGYYTTTHQAEDNAGNMSAQLFKRTIAYDPGQPEITGVSPNATYTGNAPATFTIGAQDDLEVIDGSIRIVYPNVSIADAGNATASNGLRWPFMAFSPAAARFDASIVNPMIGAMSIDQFTVSIQETDDGSLGGVAGDPTGALAVVQPTQVGATVRDVFGSSVGNFVPAANTGVSNEMVSPLLSATIPAVDTFSVTYDATANCPAGGVIGGACVTDGINFRQDGKSGSTYSFRAVQDMSETLPIFTRVDLFGLNAANEWVFIQRISVPASISPTGAAIPAGAGTITGSDNSFERYWVYSFTGVPTGFTQYRALGVNATGHGLFSTAQP